MQMGTDPRTAALKHLDVLVGEWRMEVSLPTAAPNGSIGGGASGRVEFEWVLAGQYLIQRSSAPDPVPDSVAIISADPDGETYVQHYFDSRGVTRVYEMTLADRVWTLTRTKPDFSPLAFSQRFTSTFSDDGNVIQGYWEKSDDGSQWEHDFDLTYTKLFELPPGWRTSSLRRSWSSLEGCSDAQSPPSGVP
jgi:hypothetical protein